MERKTQISRSVAIVGRPNVGKSRLFNRLVGRRISIVHNQPGVTRDLITAEVFDGQFTLMDTGGIGFYSAQLTPKVVAEAVEEQVDFAISAAALILLVVDATEGCTAVDIEIAHKLRISNKEVIIVVNKADTVERDDLMSEFYTLGFKEPLLVSAEHGRGIFQLQEKILAHLGPSLQKSKDDAVKPIRLALAGRPNVGKSSLGNCLLGNNRLIVSEIAGTTRDPVHTRVFRRKSDGTQREFILVDTAGRRTVNMRSTLDFFSQIRADEILEETDVVFLVLDAGQGVTRIDKQLAGELAKIGCGIVIVVNKWDIAKKAFRDKNIDGFEDEEEFRTKFRSAIRRELFFLPEPPILFISAKTGLRAEDSLDAAEGVYIRAGTAIPTGKLNRVFEELMIKRPPRMLSGKRFKCYYVTQVSNRPIRFRLFCNSEERLEDAYQRYLIKGVHEKFELIGVPVFMDVVGKSLQTKRRTGGLDSFANNNLEKATPVKNVATKLTLQNHETIVRKKTNQHVGSRIGKSKSPLKKDIVKTKKSFSRWEKPRSLKGRSARQARK